MRRTRPLGGIALALVLGMFVVPANLGTAHAAVGDLVCTINFQFTFSPPLTPGHTSTATPGASLYDCASANHAYPSLSSSNTYSGTGTATSAAGANPCSLEFILTGTADIKWNTGQDSDISYRVNTDPAQGTLGLTATVTAGPLTSDTATVVPIVVRPNADCATNGLKSLSGTTETNFS